MRSNTIGLAGSAVLAITFGVIWGGSVVWAQTAAPSTLPGAIVEMGPGEAVTSTYDEFASYLSANTTKT